MTFVFQARLVVEDCLQQPVFPKYLKQIRDLSSNSLCILAKRSRAGRSFLLPSDSEICNGFAQVVKELSSQ